MCGLIGFSQSPRESKDDVMSYLLAMANSIQHRGPDSHGIWYDQDTGIGLAHRRLAIQDLSETGHQPMASVSGRYYIAYNGEIYNFLEIKSELETLGFSFRGHSDTEVILAAVEKWGLARSLERFSGMFAFALVDNSRRCISLVRDRLGEKPLYYGWQNDTFLFGSELKALRLYPKWSGRINRKAIALLVRHNYIPGPHTIYENIYKLQPGTILEYGLDSRQTQVEQFWSPKPAFENQLAGADINRPESIAERLEELLLGSIEKQMIADVPVGAFLSGGIDSSVVVALMQSIRDTQVKTFTIGFDDPDYNEAEYAKSIAERLGTKHTELYVSPDQALEIIPSLAQIYDEPFADSSQIPTFLVSALARQDVTVSLSGDGGDELFCGYSRYFECLNAWAQLGRYPVFVRQPAGALLKSIPAGFLDNFVGFLLEKFSNRNPADAGRKIHEIANSWTQSDFMGFYQHFVSYWKHQNLVLGADDPAYALNDKSNCLSGQGDLRNMQYWDVCTYLVDDILTKVDRAAMANSLETRLPLLDHKVVEYASSIPEKINLMHPQGKWPLRYILQKYIPRELFERPKKGFAVPIADWLRGPLNSWANELLDESRLENEGYFDAKKVTGVWTAHVRHNKNYSFYLWSILMFQSWLESQE